MGVARRATLVALLAAIACTSCSSHDASEPTFIRFWAMGREGEVVQELVRDFERENPAVRVHVQQMPWTAAHEKLLTAHVGRSTPDIAQLGNTWVSEFVALHALEPLGSSASAANASGAIPDSSQFPGIWDTNVIDGEPYGIPWYVDTRLLFYRKDVLASAGYDSVPATWSEWLGAMREIKRVVGPDRYPIFLPINEWSVPVILGLQAGSPLLADEATRGAFAEPAFRRGFEFYVGMFETGLAPPIGNNEIANVHQEFARGYINMFITGPWNVGEYRRRLPEDLQDDWSTAALPGPDGASTGVSVAGGSSLVIFRESRHKSEAWRLVEYLSRPEVQVQFYRLTGNLPARREAWDDSTLTREPTMLAFREQLERVVPTPKVPEWELVASRLQDAVERAVRGDARPDSVLADLDRTVDRILEKRRWLLERGKLHAALAPSSVPSIAAANRPSTRTAGTH